MFILYFGGQKSGKSKLAEKKAIKLAKKTNKKPFYIATYDNSYFDNEMKKRVNTHKKQRKNNFTTIEETLNLPKVIKKNETYLIDCISMWILNNFKNGDNELIKQLKKLKKLNTNIIFVLNDVNSGVIPMDKMSRKFVDTTGIIGQKIAKICDEVYEVKLGISQKIK
ncbi:bifunctional adenosylcobinamide kinase/adenosylcobinamide-phosphate guanylyltransferase [Arcobacteraceae bacterium]|nr:bifunctional adenosylcobinamide kinase/adenosylcobinamide-phosphate guanylyltransferase [Arcobacteraceae bacterium]